MRLPVSLMTEAASQHDGQAVVIRQPGSEEEANLALQALNECPVQAIGSDRTGS